MVHLPGNKAPTKNIFDELRMWKLFFHWRNYRQNCRLRERENRRRKWKGATKGSKDTSYKFNTTAIELRALIRLYCIFDLNYGLPFFSRESYWKSVRILNVMPAVRWKVWQRKKTKNRSSDCSPRNFRPHCEYICSEILRKPNVPP